MSLGNNWSVDELELPFVNLSSIDWPAEVCINCRTEFAYPELWQYVPVNSASVVAKCSNCSARYMSIMTREQMHKWIVSLEAHRELMVLDMVEMSDEENSI